MSRLRRFLDKTGKHFKKDGKLKALYPLYEALDTFAYTPGATAPSAPHVRDSIDLKRLMSTVVAALIPCVLMACYNTGYQTNLALQGLKLSAAQGWRGDVMNWLGVSVSPDSFASNFFHGALYFVPALITSYSAGGAWEILFATVRKHEINEGFLVTGLLFPLILPPSTPWWQIVLAISFGVVVGKELFGGVGKNVFNPALTARAFLFFAYPAQISGDKVWVAVDGISKATPLAQLADKSLGMSYAWRDAFLGFIPGSMGETSTLACLIGAAVLIWTGVASWRIMLGILLGATSLSLLFNVAGSAGNPMFAVTPLQHMVLGGFAFGTVFMATDPVTSAMTMPGKYVYGCMIGALVILIRVANPAFPEGMMLSILLGNAFGPIVDRIFINAHIKKRLARNAG